MPDIGAPTPHQTGPWGLGRDDPEMREYAHPTMRHDEIDWLSFAPVDLPRLVEERTRAGRLRGPEGKEEYLRVCDLYHRVCQWRMMDDLRSR